MQDLGSAGRLHVEFVIRIRLRSLVQQRLMRTF